MGEFSAISWTDATFNCWWGCTKVGYSPACDHCYAETWAERTGYSQKATAESGKFPIWGDDAERRYFGDKHWNEPLRWNKKAEKEGIKRRVFCMSMGDWAEGRPEQKPHLDRLFDLMAQTPSLIWLMLTKRPQLIRKLYPFGTMDNPPLGIWQGVTAETQMWLDLRWKYLKEVPAEVYWLSVEPMFERIKLPQSFLDIGSRGWVICGGESGANARPIDANYARYLRDQCLDWGVRFHMKQMSGRTKAELTAIPEDLMIRQFPS